MLEVARRADTLSLLLPAGSGTKKGEGEGERVGAEEGVTRGPPPLRLKGPLLNQWFFSATVSRAERSVRLRIVAACPPAPASESAGRGRWGPGIPAGEEGKISLRVEARREGMGSVEVAVWGEG